MSSPTPFCRVDKFQSVLTPYLWASAGAPSSPVKIYFSLHHFPPAVLWLYQTFSPRVYRLNGV